VSEWPPADVSCRVPSFLVAFFFSLADHSEWNKDEMPTVCGMGMCPITSKFKGPSPTNTTGRPDVIDEAIRFFRVRGTCWGGTMRCLFSLFFFFFQANCLFKNFEVLGPADKTLIYLTLFISEVLQKIGNCDLESAKKEMYTLSIQEFWTPASPTWPLVG
jgi:actin related protein 2/3 complex, subunit 3